MSTNVPNLSTQEKRLIIYAVSFIAFGFFGILGIGFYGEFIGDWDGERAAREMNRGYQKKCIKECVECHVKEGMPLNRNMNRQFQQL